MKKTTTVIFSFVLAVLMFCSCCSVSVFAQEDAFKPVLRFIASSDTHIQTSSNKNEQRIAAMMDLGYAVAEEDPHYKALDALLVCGDLTESGTTKQFDKFQSAIDSSLRDGTRFLGVVAHGHDGKTMTHAQTREYYSQISGNTPDFHTVINGFHFIGISVSPNQTGPWNDENQVRWLDTQLAQAAADDPDKPIFVIHHEHVLGTVYGSNEGWGLSCFADVLSKYPQVVDFSGHSHYPLNDPRSLWQGEFTAIGTGALHYAEFFIDGETVHPSGYKDVATCWIVEVDAQNKIRLRGMDILSEECLCEYILDNPAKAENRPYTPEKRAEASKAPVFSPDAGIKISSQDNNAELTVSAAQSTDGMPVVLYRAFAIDKQGRTVSSAWTLPQYYVAGEQKEITLNLTGLDNGIYTVRVIAQTAYDVSSAPLDATLIVGNVSEDASQDKEDDTEDNGNENAFMEFFRRIGDWFRSIFEWFKNLF